MFLKNFTIFTGFSFAIKLQVLDQICNFIKKESPKQVTGLEKLPARYDQARKSSEARPFFRRKYFALWKRKKTLDLWIFNQIGKIMFTYFMIIRCRSDIALDIAMTLMIYCKWNTWRCQFAISVWHQHLDIGPIRLLMLSWHRHNNGRYQAERNPPGSCTTLVSTTIMLRLYCDNWKLKLQVRFFSVDATKNLQNILNNATLLKSYFEYCKWEYLLRKAY